MSFVSAAPQMSAAASELSGVGSSVGAAHAAGVTAPMAGMTGMGADEVSPGPGGAGGAGATDGAVGNGGLGDSGVIQAAGNAPPATRGIDGKDMPLLPADPAAGLPTCVSWIRSGVKIKTKNFWRN
jgi:PE family